MQKICNILTYGARPDGQTENTAQIQAALDAAQGGGEVIVPAGVFLTGALFVKSGTTLRLEKDAVLLGTTREEAYPLVSGRTAGVEMLWPAGILNVRDAEQVRICGEGTIDGQGEYWWNKFWGPDRRGGMMAEYERKGLRWAADYDCRRVRNLIVLNSRRVTVEQITSRRSGFWNIHLCYSSDVVVRGVTVRDNMGPSTDGVDVDSCCGVLVEGCTISCNDDNICVKSGRDADGLRVNRICEKVTIRNNLILEGEGITLGSETSGNMRDIVIENNRMRGTRHGFCLKSAKNRGGGMHDVVVDGLEMTNVHCAFDFDFNWFPQYSYAAIPREYEGAVPEYWPVLVEPVPEEKGLPHAQNISVKNVRADYEDGYEGPAVAFRICGYAGAPFRDLRFSDCRIRVKELGQIADVERLVFDNVAVECR